MKASEEDTDVHEDVVHVCGDLGCLDVGEGEEAEDVVPLGCVVEARGEEDDEETVAGVCCCGCDDGCEEVGGVESGECCEEEGAVDCICI